MKTFIRELLSSHPYVEQSNTFTLDDGAVITLSKGSVRLETRNNVFTLTRRKDTIVWLKNIQATVASYFSRLKQPKTRSYVHPELCKLSQQLFGEGVSYDYRSEGGVNNPSLNDSCECSGNSHCDEHALEYVVELELYESDIRVAGLTIEVSQQADANGGQVWFSDPDPLDHDIYMKTGWLEAKKLSEHEFAERVRKFLLKAEQLFPGAEDYQEEFLRDMLSIVVCDDPSSEESEECEILAFEVAPDEAVAEIPQ